MSGFREDCLSQGSGTKKAENQKTQHSKDVIPGNELWTDGLICAFEFLRGQRKSVTPKSYLKIHSAHQVDGRNIKKQGPTCGGNGASTPRIDGNNLLESTSLIDLGSHHIDVQDDNIDGQNSQSDCLNSIERFEGNHWTPIGWARISELVQTVQVDTGWALQHFDFMDDEDELTVADVAAPYWERPAGPIWWCHVAAAHPSVSGWLNNAQWLHPAITLALRDESRLISERMKHLLYEVPVRVAGGLLFELLGQSAGDPYNNEDDIPIVLRSWQSHNFLITALHIKGSSSSINELLLAGSYNTPRRVHEVIAQLACRLAWWDDRLFWKSIFGAADEVELKFMNRRNHEDLNLFSIILNQEIRRLSRQVIRVKWSLHAREEIVFELLQHLRGNATKSLLEGI